MDFKSESTTLRSFFTDKKYIIPRYQREYSWGKEQLEDFYSDIISNIKVENEKYETHEYFFGTVILVGNMEKHDNPIEVIDGQQRITTITIFLSALSNMFFEYNKDWSEMLWKYIIARNNDGELYAVMKNDTASPYFEKKIQKRNIKLESDMDKGVYPIIDNEDIKEKEKELTTEERLIKEAYDFFKEKLSDENLSAPVFKNSSLSKVEKLKLVRDQLLGSSFVYIISENVNDVNVIFENINSKGLRLSALDLIKNEIFSVQNETVPSDDAKEIWADIKTNLQSGGKDISVQKFYRYFWISRYTPSSENDLYKNFKKNISEKEYMDFLKELKKASKNYVHIVKPKDDYFRISTKGNNVGKEDLEGLIRSLNFIQDTFNIEQVQVLLITLIEKYNSKSLSFKNMMSMVRFLEEFHFIYNGIMKERNNRLVNIYGKISRKIFKLKDNNQIVKAFDELKQEFKALLPEDNQKFLSNFVQLSYSSKTDNMKDKQKRINQIARYAIYKIEEKLSEDKNSSFDRASATIEHIIPESSANNKKLVLNIGNLIILENILNGECGSKSYKEKIPFYKESNYQLVKTFLSKYPGFSKNDIEKRSEAIGLELYGLITRKW